MQTQAVRAIIEQLTPLENKDWLAFESILSPISYPAQHTVLKIGHTSNAIYFITEGAMKVYTKNGDEEISVDFAFPRMFITAYHSFITRSPSLVALATITPVEGFAFQYADLQQLYQQNHTAERIGRLLAEQQYIRKYQRELAFLQHTAQERYQQLLAEHAQIVQQIPVKNIASYLGIAPESLSRIRRQLRAKN
ncbi:CRP-like cAMP-binding protein [Chitinophaga skermanii]|uniref:CRP-like cAMP-binding protein n=1 Tax=Chitinophaga skermanii TaxID=331697 RepID=A0A327QLB1_9BACT|nr:Crp/Fnr family transcriptional regulator [Chitinophaga skermanii]RAJ05080.1 CRP-like cAMP-binding protein [Chitinophaga skermanii]